MNITLRQETAKDYRKVEEVARDAFWNLYFPGCSEHFVIHKMRTHEDFIPELSYVIEVDEELVGSIFYTKSYIVKQDKQFVPTITFGPVSIHPDYHRKGLGRRLIEHTIAIAKQCGYRAILTLGYPHHYEPYGFKGGKVYNISMPDGKFYKGLLVLPLFEDALKNVSGYAQFADVLEEIDQDALSAFDKRFPYKEKKVQESQKEFEIASMLLDE